jgi:4-hydroxy-2-oxoheptanedioate aldolase
MKINSLNNSVILHLATNNLVSIKTSFEDEGADFVEVLFLKTFCDRNNIPLILKIGGGEAIRDIKDANKMQIGKLVAPMLESKFALEKFIQSCDKYYDVDNGELAINVESKTCYENLQDISLSPYFSQLSSITVGRGDLVQSMELDRYNGAVDSNEVLDIARNVFTLARNNNMGCTLGGSMTSSSENFVITLIEEGLLDKFETRNVIFNKKALNYYSFSQLIKAALDFELNYLKSKRDYYDSLYNQDITRINKLSL